MMDFAPLSPVPGLDPSRAAETGGPAARLRYQQTKIPGAPQAILVGADVAAIVAEQQQFARALVRAGDPAAADPPYLFLAWQANTAGARHYRANTLNGLLTRLAAALQVTDATGAVVDFQRTHRMRHTKATDLLNAGVPIHVVQRYMGHVSPEMVMYYAKTLAETHEAEFLRFAKLRRDGRPLEMDPADGRVGEPGVAEGVGEQGHAAAVLDGLQLAGVPGQDELAIAAIIYIPPLQHLLGTAALPPQLLLIMLPFPFIVWGADEIRRYLLRRIRRPGSQPFRHAVPDHRTTNDVQQIQLFLQMALMLMVIASVMCGRHHGRRALMKQPAVYLFDDCFSAPDAATDAGSAALRTRKRDATVVIVAQRLSTIMHADLHRARGRRRRRPAPPPGTAWPTAPLPRDRPVPAR
jgi:Phage integrase family